MLVALWFAEEVAEITIGFAVRNETGQLDKHWVERPQLLTPGGCEVNHFKTHLLRKSEILLII